MSEWPELLSTALVGTDRRTRASATDAAAELLDAAAAWSLYRRAGELPLSGMALPAAAPPESCELVVPAAAARIGLLVDPSGPFDAATRSALLTEWMRLALAHRRRIPPELLPGLMDRVRRQPELRALIVAVGGARVGWLARQNPDWSHFREPDSTGRRIDDARHWHSATRGQRRRYVRDLRAADPAAALDLIQPEWSTLGPDERLGFIGLLTEGLDQRDEAFLEQALDDRRSEVRRMAADLLGALGGSAYNERMTARARSYLRVVDGHLIVTPPQGHDANLARDGIERPEAGAAEQTRLLGAVLARTPLAELTSLEPAEFLGLLAEEPRAPAILRALAAAAVTQQSPQWAAALLDALEASAADLADPLYPVLGVEELTRRADVALATGPTGDWIAALTRCRGPWPPELATATIAAWETAAAAPGPTGNATVDQVVESRKLTRSLDKLSRHAALSMPPSVADDVIAAVRRMPEDDRPASRVEPLAWLASVLHFRHLMTLEIA